MLDIGVEPFPLLSTVLGVMARLVRTLRPHCRESGAIDEETWKSLTAPWQVPKPASVNLAKGCLECRMTGYRGRVGIYEMMTLTHAQRGFITAETDLTKVREQAMRDGMKPLRVSGSLKVASAHYGRRGDEVAPRLRRTCGVRVFLRLPTAPGRRQLEPGYATAADPPR